MYFSQNGERSGDGGFRLRQKIIDLDVWQELQVRPQIQREPLQALLQPLRLLVPTAQST
jgi:hypothetical protein